MHLVPEDEREESLKDAEEWANKQVKDYNL